MKTKWYFLFLIALFAFFAVNQQNTAVPNQEIVLEFTNTQVTSSEVRSTIATVKKQLLRIGIVTTKVIETKDHKLKISYYSTIDVDRIKKALSNAHNRDYQSFPNTNEEDSSFPFNKKQNHYNLDVYEILKGIDAGSGFKGKYVISVKQELDRFSNPNVYHFTAVIDDKSIDKLIKTAQKINKTIAIAIDNSSHNIPEVRAGPLC